ncbi:DUF7332 family protein [Halorarum salinum]|uniref:Uncharacterized protein n=1 Tax=Halorarum salinum TaxID=2743089 RepID=A0A7D5LC41_9EURY|nr:hypothetical protein [Halobaculum salinum]QLG63386.1 hypothetical protein HUG12_17255 [Halobaculum salinum]
MRCNARALALAALLLVAAIAVPVAPAAADPADCFGSGEDLRIGSEGPAIDASLYASLFTNLPGEGAFGVSLVGTTGDHRIVTLRTGVVFAGVGDAGEFLSDPFSRFGLAFDYRFELPLLSAATDGGFAYESSDPPVDGVSEAECSVA